MASKIEAVYDHACWKSQRVAWAKYFQARADAEQAQMWAAELAEYLDAADVDLPVEAMQLIEMVRASLRPELLFRVRRYVSHMLRLSGAA